MLIKRLLLTTAFVVSADAVAACDLHDALVASVQAGDTETATSLYEKVDIDPNCSDDLRAWAGEYLARESFMFAVTEAESSSEKRDALTRALGYERHWRTFNELGRIAWDARDYNDAAVQFQAAIGELIEGDPDHVAEIEEISELYKMASAAVALADSPEIPVTRSGTPGGIFTSKIRGFEVVEIPLPITFEFDSAEFDEEGEKFAEALVAHVSAIQPSEIALTGHTDPRGTDEYNLALSLSRAEAVRDLLAANGYDREITIVGKGESEIPAPPEGIEEGSEEHFRIARRVAFVAR